MCRSLLWETTDARNRQFFGGKLENETIKGWGYDRVMLRELGPMAGTRMAADPKVPKVHRFIALGGEPRLMRHNSRLPLVVYVPARALLRQKVLMAFARRASVVVALPLVLVAYPAMAASIACDFRGPYHPTRWTTTLTGTPLGGGCPVGVNISGAPSTVTIVGGEGGPPGAPTAGTTPSRIPARDARSSTRSRPARQAPSRSTGPTSRSTTRSAPFTTCAAMSLTG